MRGKVITIFLYLIFAVPLTSENSIKLVENHAVCYTIFCMLFRVAYVFPSNET